MDLCIRVLGLLLLLINYYIKPTTRSTCILNPTTILDIASIGPYSVHINFFLKGHMYAHSGINTNLVAIEVVIGS